MSDQLLPALIRLSQLQKVSIDRLELQAAVESSQQKRSAKQQLGFVTKHLALPTAKRVKELDKSVMLALLFSTENGWEVLRGHTAEGDWVVEKWVTETNQWEESIQTTLNGYQIFLVNLLRVFKASKSAIYSMIKGEVFSHKKLLFEALLAGVIINMVALATSLYTMQVYDRVVPTGATQTLLVLSMGVGIAILFEFITKNLRMNLYEKLVAVVDRRLSRSVFMRFLGIRLDQLPQSVGSLSAQLRGYESVRSFLTTLTTHVLIDAPFSLLYGLIIFAIAGWLALIPVGFLFVATAIGFLSKRKIDRLAAKATEAVNFKTGMLVETVEGAETIKSGQGGWRMLSRWMNTSDEARDYEQQQQKISEHSQHIVGSLQQTSYIALVASGALLITAGDISMGALIACSILSGRILSPAAAVPRLLVQWANTKASLIALDRMWLLEDDHYGQEQPIVLENIKGNYTFSDVVVEHNGRAVLSIPKLSIKAGEKVGILGPVGSGKTTLLRALTGMYKPQHGRILLDDVDLSHLSKPVLAKSVGFLQQEGRLFAGTVRENLILGLLDPGDDVILEAARATGLLQTVITPHPEGLQQKIFEGGTGLSGGQRQLVNLTRVYLANPKIWLLDEPTASMDTPLETQVRDTLKREIKAEDTLVIVTHKLDMLALVDRVIVVAGGQLILDGPRDAVLHRLNNPKGNQAQQVAQNPPAAQEDGQNTAPSATPDNTKDAAGET